MFLKLEKCDMFTGMYVKYCYKMSSPNNDQKGINTIRHVT